MEAGVAEGREVGRLLSLVEAWWLDEDFAPDHAQLIEKLKSLIGTAS